jgi:hypothetical protein
LQIFSAPPFAAAPGLGARRLTHCTGACVWSSNLRSIREWALRPRTLKACAVCCAALAQGQRMTGRLQRMDSWPRSRVASKGARARI